MRNMTDVVTQSEMTAANWIGETNAGAILVRTESEAQERERARP